MADRLPSFYAVGTATVEQGGTVVTGQDTLWAGKIWPGDRFGTHLGFGIRVLSVDSNEQLTLAYPCPFAQTAAAYEIGITPDTARMQETTRLLMTKLRNGNLEAFSDIAGNIDMVPVFTGPGAMDAVPLSELTRGIDVDAKVATLAERDGFDDRAAGFSVLVNNIGDGRAAIYTKASAAVGDWSVPAFITGPQGSLTPFEFVAPEELAPGSTPTVSNTGTPTAPKMKFGIPSGRGFYSKGDYAAGTTYQTDDVVLFNGSSWIALQETTGNAPPALPTTENAWWRLIARHGNDGLGTVTELVSGNLVDINSADPTKPVVSLKSMASQRILGRQAAGVGDVELLTGDQVRGIATAARDTAATSTDTADWNTITTPGFHPNVLGTTNANAPVSGQFFYCEVKRYTTDQNLIQIAYPYRNTGGGLWYRIRATGTWGAWSQIGSDATGLLLSVGGAQAFDATQRAQGRANLGFPAMSAIRRIITGTDNATYTSTTTTSGAGNGGSISVTPSSDTSSLIVLCNAYVDAVASTAAGVRVVTVMKYYNGSSYVTSPSVITTVNGYSQTGVTGTGGLFRSGVFLSSYLTQSERRSDTGVWLARLGFSLNAGTEVNNYNTQFICIEVDTVS